MYFASEKPIGSSGDWQFQGSMKCEWYPSPPVVGSGEGDMPQFFFHNGVIKCNLSTV